jgi:hypothetical protein
MRVLYSLDIARRETVITTCVVGAEGAALGRGSGSARGRLLVPPALRESPPPPGFSAVHLDFFALAVGIVIYLSLHEAELLVLVHTTIVVSCKSHFKLPRLCLKTQRE